MWAVLPMFPRLLLFPSSRQNYHPVVSASSYNTGPPVGGNYSMDRSVQLPLTCGLALLSICWGHLLGHPMSWRWRQDLWNIGSTAYIYIVPSPRNKIHITIDDPSVHCYLNLNFIFALEPCLFFLCVIHWTLSKVYSY